MAVLVCFRDARGVGAVLVAVVHGPAVHAGDVAWSAPVAVVVHLVFLQALSALSAHKEHHRVLLELEICKLDSLENWRRWRGEERGCEGGGERM